jgi:large subunit ribosomal protein L4e
VRPAGQAVVKRPFTQHKNPLKNIGVMVRLNPYAQTLRRRDILAEQVRKEKKTKGVAKSVRPKKVKNSKYIKSMLNLE